jgi:hypothetical protein
MGHQIYRHEAFPSTRVGYFVLAFSKCFSIIISLQGKYGEFFYQLYERYALMRCEPKICIVKSGVP